MRLTRDSKWIWVFGYASIFLIRMGIIGIRTRLNQVAGWVADAFLLFFEYSGTQMPINSNDIILLSLLIIYIDYVILILI